MHRLLAMLALSILLPAVGLPAMAEDEGGPDAFDMLLLVTTQYSPDPDDGELLELWMSVNNETDPELLEEPVCYMPLEWEWPEFYAYTEYTAEDEYGTWDAMYSLYGVMDDERLIEIDGTELPYIGEITVSVIVEWYGEDGGSYGDAWTYTLHDIPPVYEPRSEYFTEMLPWGLPYDRLTYSLHTGNVKKYMSDWAYGFGSAHEDYPEDDYYDEIAMEAIKRMEFDLIMYYFDDVVE